MGPPSSPGLWETSLNFWQVNDFIRAGFCCCVLKNTHLAAGNTRREEGDGWRGKAPKSEMSDEGPAQLAAGQSDQLCWEGTGAGVRASPEGSALGVQGKESTAEKGDSQHWFREKRVLLEVCLQAEPKR